MKDTSKHPQTTSTTLTTTNLKSISDRAKFDKAQFIETYVRTQRTYRKSYEEEGRTAWGKEGGEGARKEQTPRVSEQTGFGTPILKARAPEKIDASKERPTQRTSVVSGKKKDARKKGEETLKTERTQPLHTSTSDKKLPPARQNSRKVTSDDFGAIKQNAHGASGKGKEPDDPERAELLAGRRERRRTKKAIIAPKESDGEDMAKDSEDKPKKGKTATKTKKTRKGDISAGLALMHGFSATNVGAMRLTMKPSLGVFTKGKASAKTGVSSKTTSTKSKSLPHIWTESQFLNKRKHASSRDKSKSPVHSESSSVTSSATKSPPPKKRKREPSVQSNASPKKTGKIKICNYSKRSKHKKTASSSPLKSAKADHEHEPAEVESVIWDIESLAKEPTKESAEPEKDASKLSSNSSRHNNTLILNVQATRWNGAPSSAATRTSDMVAHSKQPARGPPSDTEQEKGKDSVLDAQSSSSLCPSHSASQAMPLLGDPRNMQPPVSRSKYFKNTAPVSSPDGDDVEPLSLDYEDTGPCADERMHQVSDFGERDAPHHSDAVLTYNSPICAAADPPSALNYLSARPDSVLQDDQDSLYSSSNLGDPRFLAATHSYITSPATGGDPWNLPQDPAYYSYEAGHYCSSCIEDEEFDDEVDNMVFGYSQESRLTDGLPEVLTPAYDDTGYVEGYFYGSDYAMAYEEALDRPETDCDAYSNPYGYHDATPDDEDAGAPSSAIAYDEPLSFGEPDVPGMESFLPGQAYLRGYSPADSVQDNPSAGLLRLPTLAQVEDGVARRLHGHWKPQKL